MACSPARRPLATIQGACRDPGPPTVPARGTSRKHDLAASRSAAILPGFPSGVATDHVHPSGCPTGHEYYSGNKLILPPRPHTYSYSNTLIDPGGLIWSAHCSVCVTSVLARLFDRYPLQ